jgi:hypothetical protein
MLTSIVTFIKTLLENIAMFFVGSPLQDLDRKEVSTAYLYSFNVTGWQCDTSNILTSKRRSFRI